MRIMTCSGVIALSDRLRTDVSPVVHALEADLINCAVRAPNGIAIIRAPADDRENATTCGDDLGAARGGAGMKHHHVSQSLGVIQPANRFAGLIAIRVTARCEDDADARLGR